MGHKIFAPKQAAKAIAPSAAAAPAPKAGAKSAAAPPHAHAPLPLSKLEPKLSKAAAAKPAVKPQPNADETRLEDLPALAEFEEIPETKQSMEGATSVDWNQDGIPEARYRQRTP